jgi:hypothetical protein
MDSIATARNFFINQQGLSPDQADMIVSQGLQAYNQQTQPQSMMQMASGGIARLGYQMGGISAMPMDYGQPLQIPQQQQPIFTTTGSAASSDLLNYGQTGLRKAGGTPLSRPGYQEGGITNFYKGEEPIIPRIENIGGLLDQAEQSIGEPANNMTSPLATTFSRFGYESGGVTLPSQGSEMSQMGQMDQQQALQTIIQILIENGIPPEQAQQLALQILQIFAQGGEPAVEEFANQLEQAEQGDEQVQGMAKGGIAGLYPRQGYFVGKIAKAVTGAVKGVASAVKSVVKSPIGKLALTAAAIYAGGGGFGLSPGGFSLFGGPAGPGLLGGTGSFNLGSSVIGQGLFGTPALGDALVGGSKGLFGNLGLTGGFGSSLGTGTGIMGTIGKVIGSPLTTVASLASGDNKGVLGLLGAGGIGAALGSLLGAKKPEETDEQYQQRLQSAGPYLEQYYKNLNPDATPDQVSQFVRLNTAEYGGLGQGNTFAEGGIARLGYKGAGMVSPRSNPTQQDELNQAALDVFKRPLHQLTPEEVDMLIEFIKEKFGKAPMQEDTTFAAKGGSMIPPARQIEGGIIELDARKTGGYIPYGKKERVDDVPAMLAKDEFVFTSRAVKAAGGGSARQGAAKMYKLMKQLEAKGRKMERGARA